MLAASVTSGRLPELHHGGNWGCAARREPRQVSGTARLHAGTGVAEAPRSMILAAHAAKLRRGVVATGLVALAAAAPAPARAQGASPTVTNVTATFRGGPFVTLSVYPGSPNRIAIGTADGHVTWSEDGGVSSLEAQVLVPRKFDPVTIRGGSRAPLSQRGGEELDVEIAEQKQRLQQVGLPDERALLSFIYLLGLGLPAGRIQVWMQTSDAIAEMGDIAWPKGDGPMLMATQAGLLVSDQSRFSWSRTMGGPGYIPREGDIIGLSAAIDPQNPSHMLAATDRGMQVSDNGGYTWSIHPDADFEDSWITHIVWDPENPQLVFAVTPTPSSCRRTAASPSSPPSRRPARSRTSRSAPRPRWSPPARASRSRPARASTRSCRRRTSSAPSRGARAPCWPPPARRSTWSRPTAASGRSSRTSSTDPYLRLAGGGETAWLLSAQTILRIGGPLDRGPGRLRGGAPRMLVSAVDLEQAVIDYTGLGGPNDTRLHQRWYEKVLPRVTATARGTLFSGNNDRRDDIVLPFQVWQTGATAYDRLYWEVFANWDLRELLLGDNNVSNPNLIIESQIRDKRNIVLEQIRWHYRECAALVADLARPPADPELELNWRMRLEEHASYLEWMSGRKVVKRTPIEKLEYTE